MSHRGYSEICGCWMAFGASIRSVVPMWLLVSLLILISVASSVAGSAGASRMVDGAGIEGGLVVHLGCGDGKQTVALRVNECVLVHGLDRDADNVTKARDYVQSTGLYGPVSIDRLTGDYLPYVNNLVNLLVADDLGGIPMAEVMRVLAPRGVALIGGEKTVKPWPADMDEWTHFLHAPDNNAVSRDMQIDVSRSLQWIMPPSWGRHHNLLPSMSALVSAGGRIYYIIDDAPISEKGGPDDWQLICRDAFNGLLLWKAPIAKWGWRSWSGPEYNGNMRFGHPPNLTRRLVADGDRLFVTLGIGEPVSMLDGKTGEVLRAYAGTERAAEILYAGGMLYVAKHVDTGKPSDPVKITVLAVNAETGALAWKYAGLSGGAAPSSWVRGFPAVNMTLGEGRLILVEGDGILTLNAADGSRCWEVTRKGIDANAARKGDIYVALAYHDGLLYSANPDLRAGGVSKGAVYPIVLTAYDAASGREVWSYEGGSVAHGTPPDLVVAQGKVWCLTRSKKATMVGLDAKTGVPGAEYDVTRVGTGHHHRCYRNCATERYYFYGRHGIEYFNFATGELDVQHWMRGACRYGIMPANGLIYLPTHACGCLSNSKLHGFAALASPEPDRLSLGEEPKDIARLQKGDAYGRSVAQEATAAAGDWPAFRGGALRSGSGGSVVPWNLTRAWRHEFSGECTQPVVVGNRVYVAVTDRHEIHALDAQSGQPVWRVVVDGRIDSPPTYHEGGIFCGTRNGSVYRLAADTGELAWQFRAAPRELKLTSYGRLESVWPVNGSVLIHDGMAHVVAGRSMNLDGGLSWYVLDSLTGEILQQDRLEADTTTEGEVAGSVLPDILSCDGEAIYMRNLCVNPDDISKRSTKPDVDAAYLQPADGGLLDRYLLNNTFLSYRGVSAQVLSFDDAGIVGIQGRQTLAWHSWTHDIHTLGDGYRVFAVDPERQDASKGKSRMGPPPLWQVVVPVRADSMVLTKDAVCVAGAPDTVPKDDPWASFEGRTGGVLMMLSRADGAVLSRDELSSPPVFDGISAARGKLFLALRDGAVECWQGKD